jgi:hypothetical protein
VAGVVQAHDLESILLFSFGRNFRP